MNAAWSGMKTDAKQAWITAATERFGTPLLRYAARVVGAPDRAQDVVQHVFLKLWLADPPPLGDHLAPWLYTVCRRRAIDVRRKESRMNVGVERLEAVPDQGAGPEQAAEVSWALRALDALPEGQQEVLRLKFEHGLSYREIADVTGQPVGTVGSLIHVGMKALRAQLGGVA